MMRPGCIFVSHRSIQSFFLCFSIFWVAVPFVSHVLNDFKCPKEKKKFCILCCSKALLTWEYLMCGGFKPARHRMFSWARTGLQGPEYVMWVSLVFTGLPPSPACVLPSQQLCLSSVFLATTHSFDCYQLAKSTFSTCAIQRYFSISVYSFWEVSGVHFLICYIILMVNGYISWICKSIGWCADMGWIVTQRTRNPTAASFYMEIFFYLKHVLLWLRPTNGMKSTLRHINISSIFQETTPCYVRFLLLQEKKKT